MKDTVFHRSLFALVALLVPTTAWGQIFDPVCECVPQTIYTQRPITTVKLVPYTEYVEEDVRTSRRVPVTVMKERQYTVARPVTETEFREQRYLVWRPVIETRYETREYTETRMVTETEERTQQVRVQRPVTEEKLYDQVYRVDRPVTETRYREERYTTQRPVTETRMETRQYTTLRPVTQMENRVVDAGGYVAQQIVNPGQVQLQSTYGPTPYYRTGPLGLLAYRQYGHQVQPVVTPPTVSTRVAYQPNYVNQQVARTSLVPQVEQTQIPVQVTSMRPETVTRMVPETVRRTESSYVTRRVAVPVTRMEESVETRRVPVTVQRPVTETKTREVPVQYRKWVSEEKVRRYPVTSTRTVYETKSEMVPVTTYETKEYVERRLRPVVRYRYETATGYVNSPSVVISQRYVDPVVAPPVRDATEDNGATETLIESRPVEGSTPTPADPGNQPSTTDGSENLIQPEVQPQSIVETERPRTQMTEVPVVEGDSTPIDAVPESEAEEPAGSQSNVPPAEPLDINPQDDQGASLLEATDSTPDLEIDPSERKLPKPPFFDLNEANFRSPFRKQTPGREA